MDSFPFSTDGLQQDDIELFLEVYEKLKTNYDATFNGDINVDFDKSALLKKYERYDIREVIQLAEGVFIVIMEVFYKYLGAKGGEHNGHHFQAWGLTTMARDFGHVLIKRETLTEKLFELIKPVELDFPDDKAFSKKFYVLATNKEKATNAFTSPFRDLLLNLTIRDFSLEIVGNTLIFSNDKSLDPDETLLLANFIDKTSRIR